MTPRGQFDKRIAFERAATVRSALGPVKAADWAGLGNRWCKVTWGSAAERREAGAERAVQTATFRVLGDALTRSIVVTDRIVHSGLAWDIAGKADLGRGAAEIEFTAMASRG